MSKKNRLKDLGIEVISPAPRQEWLEIARADPNTLVSQTPAWIDSICNSIIYRDASRLYLLPIDRKLVLPMVKRFGFLPGLSILESPPYGWGMGGILAPGGVTSQDINTVVTDLASQPSLYTAIRPNPLDGVRWAASNLDWMVKIPRIAHVLDLEGGFEQAWSKRFESAARQNVHHAEKPGLVVERDTTGWLAPVFLQSIERWAVQQHEPLLLAKLPNQSRDPTKKFQSIAKQLGENCRFLDRFYRRSASCGDISLAGFQCLLHPRCDDERVSRAYAFQLHFAFASHPGSLPFRVPFLSHGRDGRIGLVSQV